MRRRRTAEERRIARFRWVLGTPYFVQGSSSLVEVPILYFIKFTLGMGPAGGQLFDSLRSVGWLLKPLWGFLSDRFSIAGYRRKSWFVLMACLAVVFWLLNALLASLGIRVPWVFLLTFNLAFATYAFVDVVCDALMVEEGRRLGRVGSFVNFQWAVLALATAGALFLGGWLQGQVQSGALEPWVVFAVAAVPPVATVLVGIRNVEEERASPRSRPRHERPRGSARPARWARRLPELLRSFRSFRKENRLLWLVVVFFFFWKFSPSIGFIERSYLIDERGFDAASFGAILSAGGLTFLASVLCYSWVTSRFPRVRWHQVLYAMIGLGVLSFPLSFFLYLDPDHPWWQALLALFPAELDLLPGWNRYEWFRLVTHVVLGFATIPAFLIPLTLAGETVRIEHAGVSYAFLMAFSNVTDTFEGVVGAALYDRLAAPGGRVVLEAFQGSFLEIAGATDERTLILQIFVYVSLVFTLLTIPFVELLRREIDRRGIEIRLGSRG